ncbi:FG-GAP-like repeat-containing protein [Streptomyces sp. CB03238]|uniref:FG-GAP-like repeat-containing protein n=1 Tax=Streptomyces sp. CB03238 TaxID=1907777 RepID=UPI001F4D9E17|nr:FG-GAP-like repeat-containing protein [Streptomyces sp. CB03238]
MLRHLSRSMRGAVVCAVGLTAAAALAFGTATALPSAPWATESTAAASGTATAATGAPMLPLYARTTDGRLFLYEPKGTGGVKAAVSLGGGYGDATTFFQARFSEGGTGRDLFFQLDRTLYYTAERGTDTKIHGTGWHIYNLTMSPGNMVGTADEDVIGRDAAGALWLYQGRSTATLAPRIRIGTGGWNGMNALAGRGDYTGDGKADLIARSTTGTLYIYPGTGNATADAVLGTRVTVGTGWGGYKALVSTGDNSGDGKADLIASDTAGALWLFKGTGRASAPFEPRVQIGTSGWAAFNTLF